MIKIINDFFDNETYQKVMYHIKTNIYFTPRYFEGSVEKIKENYYGDRFDLISDKNLLETFISQSEKKFNFKIKNIKSDSGIDLRNLNRFEPHVDGAKLNVLIMLDGPIGVTSGTVFYTDNELDIHIGFRPNRAILFPSHYYHSPHKCELKGVKRYTASLFITDYEE